MVTRLSHIDVILVRNFIERCVGMPRYRVVQLLAPAYAGVHSSLRMLGRLIYYNLCRCIRNVTKTVTFYIDVTVSWKSRMAEKDLFRYPHAIFL